MNKTVTFSSLGGPEVLSFTDRPARPPDEGEVQIAVNVTGFHLAWLMLDHPERRERAVAHLSSGTYEPLIDRVFAFEDVADAYRYMASNAQTGKILVEIAS